MLTDYLKNLIREVNQLRTNPAKYAEKLEKSKTYFKGTTWEHPELKAGIATQEGPKAYDEAIRFLKYQKPVGGLIPSKALTKIAQDMCRAYARDKEVDIDAEVDKYGAFDGELEEESMIHFVGAGSGAADLIWRAVFAAGPKRALVTAPCFGEYEAALEAVGCEISRFPLGEDFVLTDRILSRIDPGLDLLILCSPNNPTGRTINPSLLRAVIGRCGEAGTRLLLDECFLGFLEEPALYTGKPLLAREPTLLILRAFTKLWGMAGLRLGYGLSADAAFLDAMRRSGPPWSVSHPAQAAGLGLCRTRARACPQRTPAAFCRAAGPRAARHTGRGKLSALSEQAAAG